MVVESTYKIGPFDVPLGVAVDYPDEVASRLPANKDSPTPVTIPKEPSPELMSLLARKPRGRVETVKLTLAYLTTRQSLSDIGLGLLRIDLDDQATPPTLRVKMPGT